MSFDGFFTTELHFLQRCLCYVIFYFSQTQFLQYYGTVAYKDGSVSQERCRLREISV